MYPEKDRLFDDLLEDSWRLLRLFSWFLRLGDFRERRKIEFGKRKSF